MSPASSCAPSALPQFIPLERTPPLRRVRNAESLPPREMPGRPPLLLLSEGPAREATQAGSNPAVRVDTDTGSWRLKSPGSNATSAMEVTMAKLFRLTGLAAPQMGLADEEIATLPPDSWQVASRYDDTFQDLGSFLVSDRAARLACGGDEAKRLAYAEQRDRHAAAVVACENVLRDAGVEHFWQLGHPDLVKEHAAQDQRRFDALETMNRMQPTNLRCEQLRHYIASSWLDNWDQLNYRMENFGYAERNGQPVGMTVDFGSCGPLGFRNLVSGKMLPKSASRDIALLQRPPTLFPVPDKVCENAAGFDVMGAGSSGLPGALQDTLRWPYGFQSETIAEMIRPPVAPDPAIAYALSEMGYRLRLLSAGAIGAVVRRYWQTPHNAPAGDWPSADALIDELRKRRDTMLQRFDDGQLAAWARDHPDHALRVRQEMRAALQDVQAGLSVRDTAQLASAIQASHTALIMPSEPVTAINGMSREIRSLQAFRNAVKELAAGRQDADGARIDAAVKDLLSDRVYGQLMVNLHLGPGCREETRMAFAANMEWLQLMTALVNEGRTDAGTVAEALMSPRNQDYYPPAVAIRATDHSELCAAFIDLLDTLAHASPGVDPAELRSRILQAKSQGTPNFYTTLLQLKDGGRWKDQLARHGLLPKKNEIQKIKGAWSAYWWGGYEDTATRSLQVPAASSASAAPSAQLSLLLHKVDDRYGPRHLAKLDEPTLRTHVLSWMKLASDKEMRSVDTMVNNAAANAWRKAQQKYSVLKDVPLPDDMVKQLKDDARTAFRNSMHELRIKQADEIMATWFGRYEERVLADPGMSAEQRKVAFDECIAAIRIDIHTMVEVGQDSPPDGRVLTDVADSVESRAKGLKARAEQDAAREMQERMEEKARDDAEKQASASVNTAAAKRTDHDVTQKTQALLGGLMKANVARQADERAKVKVTGQVETQTRKRVMQETSDRVNKRVATTVETGTETHARRRANADYDAQVASARWPEVPRRGGETVADIEHRLLKLKLPDTPGTSLSGARNDRTRRSTARSSAPPLRRD